MPCCVAEIVATNAMEVFVIHQMASRPMDFRQHTAGAGSPGGDLKAYSIYVY